MNSTTILRAAGIGAVALAYIALLVFHFDILSIYTVMFAIIGAAIGVVIAYRVRFN